MNPYKEKEIVNPTAADLAKEQFVIHQLDLYKDLLSSIMYSAKCGMPSLLIIVGTDLIMRFFCIFNGFAWRGSLGWLIVQLKKDGFEFSNKFTHLSCGREFYAIRVATIPARELSNNGAA